MKLQQLLTGGFLKGKKTYVLASTAIATSIAYYLIGNISAYELYQIALPLLTAIFLRKGISDETIDNMNKAIDELKKK